MNNGNLIEAMKGSRISCLTEREIGKHAKSICEALDAIHKVGFVHGDVRPMNIYLRECDTTGANICAFGDFDRCCPIEAVGD